jgi:hypothetical protein
MTETNIKLAHSLPLYVPFKKPIPAKGLPVENSDLATKKMN